MKQQNKHTPGPWEVKKGNIITQNPLDSIGDKTTHLDTGHANLDYYGGYLVAESIFGDKDAALLASAPDLLEACKAARGVVDTLSSFQEIYYGQLIKITSILDQAIFKAEAKNENVPNSES